jgi:hypothetical protein
MNDGTSLGSEAHRSLAVRAYNDCWDLLESVRTPQQDRDLVGLAYTSRYHWQQSGGGAEELAIADWMVSRCLAAVGAGALAIDAARAALDAAPADSPTWLQASLFEGLARAFSAAGRSQERDAALKRARVLIMEEPDAESRALIEEQIASVR